MKYVIDKVIDGVAVCECLDADDTISIPLPEGAKEGVVLHFENGRYSIDHLATKQRLQNLDARLKRLFTSS